VTRTGEPAVIAVDLGGTRLRAALVAGGRVVRRREQATQPAHGAGAWIEAMAALVEDWRGQAGALGIATTGVIRDGRWFALNPEVLPVPAGFALVTELECRLGLPVQATNDGHAAAWGEFRHGSGQGSGSCICLTISTGIGGGIVMDGRLQRGGAGLAGSLGHVLADPAGPRCGCGKVGCLEAIASGGALEVMAREGGYPTPVRAGPAWAERLLDRSAQAVARALCDLRALIDPEIVVLGGGLGLSNGFIERVRRGLESHPRIFRPRLEKAALGGDAGLIGAADLALAA
jgi:predicted NBD/HSP70 family sugar kinase